MRSARFVGAMVVAAGLAAAGAAGAQGASPSAPQGASSAAPQGASSVAPQGASPGEGQGDGPAALPASPGAGQGDEGGAGVAGASGAAPARAARPVPARREAPVQEESDEATLVLQPGALPEVAKRKWTPRDQHVSIALGFQGSSVGDAGYDPYSKDNTFITATLAGTFTAWDTRPFSIHLAFEYAYGNSQTTARGNDSNLDVHKLGLGLEGRFMPLSRMILSVRAVPSAMHLAGTVVDPYLVETLAANTWTWGVDLTGGAAARIGAVGDVDRPVVAFWIGLDMGYRFAGAAAMGMRPADLSDEDASRRFGEVPMAPLDLSGFIGRLSASVAF